MGMPCLENTRRDNSMRKYAKSWKITDKRFVFDNIFHIFAKTKTTAYGIKRN